MKVDVILPNRSQPRKTQHAPPSNALVLEAREMLLDLPLYGTIVLTLEEKDESRFAVRDAFLRAEAAQGCNDPRHRLRIRMTKSAPWVVTVKSLRASSRSKKAAE